MECRDFERMCNELLDARTDGLPEAERVLEAHAAACPTCRTVAERYQVLRQAIGALGPPPAPPADFATRFLEGWDWPDPAPAPRLIRLRPPAWWAAAAALLLMAGLGVRSWLPSADRAATPLAPPGPPEASQGPTRPLAAALADATAATLDLAWETSAPAARVGSEVLGDVAVPDAPTAVPLPVPIGPATETWQAVGDRVNAGVRPLSGTARHAFGFLLAPALDVKDADPDAETGA